MSTLVLFLIFLQLKIINKYSKVIKIIVEKNSYEFNTRYNYIYIYIKHTLILL